MQKKEETILKEILWGERPIDHLPFVKIRLHKGPEGYTLENTRDLNLPAGPKDVARGLLRYRQEPARLSEWAGFILTATELYGLELNRTEEGRVLEAALRAAAAGQTPPAEALATARALVPAFPKKRALGEPEQYGPPT